MRKSMNEFYLIEKIISEIKTEVNLYQELFGDDQNVKALNKSYPEAFGVFQRAMFFEIICRISAIFDPAQMRSDKNLTLEHLVDLCGDETDKELYLKVESLKFDFKKTGIKEIRNKVYAHNDLKHYLNKRKFTTNISYELITELLDNMLSVVRSLGIQSGMVKPDQIIARDTKLPKGKNGQALVSKLSNA